MSARRRAVLRASSPIPSVTYRSGSGGSTTYGVASNSSRMRADASKLNDSGAATDDGIIPDHAVAGHPPYCDRCGNLLRPGVVWFGEALPFRTLEAAQQAAQACDLMLVVGTAGAVYPAAGLAHQARAAGARVVVVNPAPSELDGTAHAVLRAPAAQVLPTLLG